jgi:exosortase
MSAPDYLSTTPAAYQTAADQPSKDRWNLLAHTAWVKTGVITLLVFFAFWPNLTRLWTKTNPFYGEPNWGHSMCVPLIGLYYLYVNREAILAAPHKSSWAGFFFALGGVLLYGYGIWPGQNDFVKDVGMVVTLFGIVLMMTGWAVMKIVYFPIVFLICALPWPGLVYSKVASPLQQLAANVAVFVLQATGVTAYAGGTKIVVHGHGDMIRTLNVAEACAGLRSLMTFISVAAAVAFLSSRALWEKIIIVLSAIPIAIFCNVMRISGQGLLDHYVSQQLSENFAHAFVGLVMMVPAFLMILSVGWILDQAFVQEAAPEEKIAPQILRRNVPVAQTPPPATAGLPRTNAAQQAAPSAPIAAVPPAFRSPMRKNVPPRRPPETGGKS